MQIAVDPEGDYMMHVSDEYAAKALARREVARTDEGHLVVVPQSVTPKKDAQEAAARAAKRESRNR